MQLGKTHNWQMKSLSIFIFDLIGGVDWKHFSDVIVGDKCAASWDCLREWDGKVCWNISWRFLKPLKKKRATSHKLRDLFPTFSIRPWDLKPLVTIPSAKCVWKCRQVGKWSDATGASSAGAPTGHHAVTVEMCGYSHLGRVVKSARRGPYRYTYETIYTMFL